MITVKENEGRKEFYLPNGVLLGHTSMVNNHYYFSIHMPEAGIWDAKELLAIADKLNELNGQSPLPSQEVEQAALAGGPFFIEDVRAFLDGYNNKEISISKITENLNISAQTWVQKHTSCVQHTTSNEAVHEDTESSGGNKLICPYTKLGCPHSYCSQLVCNIMEVAKHKDGKPISMDSVLCQPSPGNKEVKALRESDDVIDSRANIVLGQILERFSKYLKTEEIDWTDNLRAQIITYGKIYHSDRNSYEAYLKECFEADKALQSLPSIEVQDDWVKVEGSIVAQNEWLLVYNGHWTGVAKFNKEKDAEYPEPEWQDENGEYFTPYPTHYMPLPLPPGSQTRIPYSIEAELKRHSDTWDAAYGAGQKESSWESGKITRTEWVSAADKETYLQSLTDKLRKQ